MEKQYQPPQGEAVRVIEVIEVSRRRGKGTDGDPARLVLEYWSCDGVLLAERDAWAEQHAQNAAGMGGGP